MESGKKSSMTREKVKLLEAAGEFSYNTSIFVIDICYPRILLTRFYLHELIARLSMGEAKRNPR